jgi:undecaprenyl-diphosphatase
MWQALETADRALFFWINRGHQNRFFDWIMPVVTDFGSWEGLTAVLFVALVLYGGKNGRWAALLSLPLVLATDQISSSLVKHLVARPRPCNVLEGVHLLIPCTQAFAFPSGHATNMFGVATLFSGFFTRGWPFFMGIAALVSYSRIYVGVHYPLDCLGGGVLGAGLALLFYGGYRFFPARKRKHLG